MNIETRQMIEKGIAKRVVRSAIALGYTVSIWDGGDWPVKRSSKLPEIIRAMFTVDEESLEFCNAEGGLIGTAWFVYGNAGWDALADYTATETMERLLKDANEYAESMAFHYA
jgi:hypothetical protein